jgi:uncharacterized DUF497 family protein
MAFEWDTIKNARNIRERGIDFADAVGIFEGPTLIDYDGRADYGEDRWIAVGIVEATALVVVYVDRGDVRRIISARKATTNEQRDYYETIFGSAPPWSD